MTALEKTDRLVCVSNSADREVNAGKSLALPGQPASMRGRTR